jgi:hypothetical protein
MKTKTLFVLIPLATVFFVFSCSKESDTSTVRVMMTDAPALWDEVNIDLERVEIKFAKDSSSWLSMQTNAAIYNLLGLQNGVDTLIAQGTFQADVVKEIRLVLGTDNTIMVNGQIFELTVPSGAESGLKIKVDKDLDADIETLTIDFDAALSVNTGPQGYFLVPVIRLK